MRDPLSKADRSALMSKVRSKGNKSTEQRVEITLEEHGISEWVKHPANIPGSPDFYFPRFRLMLFVDGCFWHACPACARRTPRTHTRFWEQKIESNRRRDNRIRRRLRSQGYHVMRVWEHDLGGQTWLQRLRSMVRRLDSIQPGRASGSSGSRNST